ncbi:paraneoplastic antigen Ma6E-like [Macrobrachium rosenbergii]|uniref:paraneoplastic antigen Ma6E-like n=1 Tax=Macrobrachium rosenbergii TaxID=79674 RepID=UPI0034D7313E
MAVKSPIQDGAAEVTGASGMARVAEETWAAETSMEETGATRAASTAQEPGKLGAVTGATGTARAGEARTGQEPGRPGARTGVTGIAGASGEARKAWEPSTPGTAGVGTMIWGTDEVTIMEGPGWDSRARKPDGSSTA